MDEGLRILLTTCGIIIGSRLVQWFVATYKEGRRLDRFRFTGRR